MNAAECFNEQWVAENPGHTIEWARGMWSCDCPTCVAWPEQVAR